MSSASNISIQEYCRPFVESAKQWPSLPLPVQPGIKWWQKWLNNTPREEYFQSLRSYLPQLCINPHHGASNSKSYKQLVLRGNEINKEANDNILQLKDQQSLSVRLVEHPCGTYPVIEVEDQNDFLSLVRCLAYRCELKQIQPSVHAQAVSGLIHWGLIRETNLMDRCQLIILHRSPYSCLPSSVIPGKPTTQEWLEISQSWRLEHELTHLATKRLAGEMRLNLFDELVADALGMLKALKLFSADLFRQGIGLNNDASTNSTGRVHTYLKGLNENSRREACIYVLQRAQELEQLIATGLVPKERMALLRYLLKQKLDQPFTANK